MKSRAISSVGRCLRGKLNRFSISAYYQECFDDQKSSPLKKIRTASKQAIRMLTINESKSANEKADRH